MISNKKIILITVLLVILSISAYVIVVVVPSRLAEQAYEGAKQIGRDVGKLFNITPEVIVNNTIVLQQQTAILELATVSQKFQHQYDWINTWLGSTKKVFIQGTFEAKAGFDLQKRFTIRIENDRATIVLPAPRILSVELLGDASFKDEHGVWNWINNEDRSKAINAFQQDARKYAAQADFIQQAKINMEKELKNIFKLHGKEVEVIFVTASLTEEKGTKHE
jgi:uncharacterized protein DUF4230